MGETLEEEEEWVLTDPREAKTDTRTSSTGGWTGWNAHRLDGLDGRRLVRYGVSLRSDVRRLDEAMTRLARAQVRTEDNLAEATDKLNGLIDIVDKMARR
jgi:hypothetical protein